MFRTMRDPVMIEVINHAYMFILQKKHRMYQWIMQKRSDNQANESGGRAIVEEPTSLNLNVLEEPFDGELGDGCDLCGENGQTLCWHKVEKKFEFVFRVRLVIHPSLYCNMNLRA